MNTSWLLTAVILSHFMIQDVKNQTVVPERSMCGPETELKLSGTGIDSSLILALTQSRTHTSAPCKIRVIAPDTHIVHVALLEDEEQEIIATGEETKDTSCILNVYLPENRRTAVWRSDPCNHHTLHEGGLLTHQLRIVWNPPSDPGQARGRRLLLTAIGQGAVCHSERQHACIKVGWSPLICISEELLCDGVPHCPPGATHTDEDLQLCRDRKVLSQTSWEEIAAEFIKKFAGKSRTGSLLPAIHTSDESRWLLGRDSLFTTTEKHATDKDDSRADSMDNLSSALAHYGPWGYLMLGMLICGTVLMFCGLWECCCRRAKPSSDSNLSSQPTTVLIINSSAQEEGQMPPNYEDLDQPPSYNALFPTKRSSGVTAESSVRLNNENN